MSNSKAQVSPATLQQVQTALMELLRDPIPPYALLGLELHVHDGAVKRIKTRRETQVEVQEKNQGGLS